MSLRSVHKSIIYIYILILMISCVACTSTEADKVSLTKEEIAWLKEHENDICFGYTTDYPPVEFLKEGQYVGFSADYFHLLEEKLGVKFQMVEYKHWNALMDDARQGKITGITAATKTEDRTEHFEFTLPYILNPNVIITRENFSEQLSFMKLEDSSMKVVVVEDYAIIEYLDDHYPLIEYIEVESASEGLRMVSLSEADAMIIEIMSASASIERDHITNLMVNTETSYDSNLSVAVHKDWAPLNLILNKGFAQITEVEKQAIRAKWMPLEKNKFADSKYFWLGLLAVGGVFTVIIITISIWNRTLQRAVDEKTNALNRSYEKLELQNKQLEYTEQLLRQEIEVRKASEERIKYKSYHDELTGLYNRAFYNEELMRCDNKENLPLSIILADLNGLKITNDTLGHEEGDKLLMKIATIIKNNCRDIDTVARIGGDEFVVILPKASDVFAQVVCGKIKDACKNADLDPIKPTVALGAATKTERSQNLQTLFKIAEDNMYENKMYESEGVQCSILESMKAMLRTMTTETTAHSRRMEEMARKMGQSLGLSIQDLNALATLADLHDLGKVAIPEDILEKEGPLTEEEWERIKRHPDIGFKIASSSPKLTRIADGILAHHEKWDGSGYPHGLKGKEIPILARIIAIVDAYDVMTTGRPYRLARTKKEAIQELRACSGSQFDPELVILFKNLFSD